MLVGVGISYGVAWCITGVSLILVQVHKVPNLSDSSFGWVRIGDESLPAPGPAEGLGAGKRQELAILVLGRGWIFGQAIASKGGWDASQASAMRSAGQAVAYVAGSVWSDNKGGHTNITCCYC